MRLFIASPVRLDDYASIQEDFKDSIEGKWVAEENLHLTWVFLGNRVEYRSIIKKMQSIPALESEVAVEGLGYFGRPPRIFFSKAASKLLYAKAREFNSAGFDLYRFKPHITLCRIKKITDYRTYKELIKSYRERVLGAVKPEIILYRSILSKSGPQYESVWETATNKESSLMD